jgi:thermostable 8-oxoguanine DNA glycosylase
MTAKKDIVKALLDRHGQTFAHELGIDVGKNTPSPLFRLLCFSLLAGSRISSGIAMKAAKALADAGWTTAQKMDGATWRQRTDTLNHSGYARYDESTSRYLGDTSKHLLDAYGGDLRKLREAAEHDPDNERKLLKKCKGIGDVSASIFFREAQAAWDELYPFADKVVLKAANKLDLGRDANELARLVDKRDYPRLVAALVRTDLAGDYDAILK